MSFILNIRVKKHAFEEFKKLKKNVWFHILKDNMI